MLEAFPGWLAIDFGISNSTVTLYDPIGVPMASSLPKEQEMRLRQLLAQWLNLPATNALPGVNANEWEKFIDDISKNLGINSSQLHEFFQADNQDRYLEGVRQIELCLGRSEQFRRSVSKRLYQIYHEVFRVPTLESQNLIPVPLDLDTRSVEISSELEITSLTPLKVRMGREAKYNKNKAISLSTSNSLEEIISRFHYSLKPYFGQDRQLLVSVDGKQETIQVNQLIQAAWGHLIELTDYYRKHRSRSFSKGDFQKVVITYPTIAPPLVRNQVKQFVEDLGIEDVQTVDEATAVLMFYLWREFGNELNIDMEYFKTLCRRKGEKWSQNVLVLDIGGGATDLALIELTLKDITPSFRDKKDRGLGGRYYQITSKLLGSSGHLQLGGELITLRMFRLLKVAIVDCLLTAIATGSWNNNKLNDLVLNLNERFLEQGKYKQGSLLKCIDKQYPENDYTAYKDALDTAEKMLPTRWKYAPERLQTFYTLWDHAEAAKIKLGQKPPKDSSILTYTLSEAEISELLNQVNINIQSEQKLNNLFVTINSEQFERAAYLVIREAIGIAKALVENRLGSSNNSNDNSDTEQKKIETEKVDWLILSGKTCNLDMVQRETYQKFSTSDNFLWNSARISFDAEFTKLATSAGACYAEKMRLLKFNPEEAKPLLRKGANYLNIDVQNLFYYLPCNFKRKTRTSDLLDIFQAGQELYQLSPTDTGLKVRTEWQSIQLSNIIYRQDYEGAQLQLWGSFNGNNLWNQLKQSDPLINLEEFFLNTIKIQFEVDLMLDIRILLCREQPHYLIDDRNSHGIDVTQITTATNTSTETPALFSSEKLNHGDIAVNVLESNAVDRPNDYHLVFASGNSNTECQKFRYSSDSNQLPVKGLISKPLPDFPESGKHTFYICDTTNPETKDKRWLRIGELSKPDVTPDFPCQYRVTLDEKGILRLHAGEVPYWESNHQNCLLEEGYVFRTQLDLQPNDVYLERDPFCGIH
ncbi:molecular chaperone [Nostoc punctiforme FACHB-252]|uniref:Molecular chaperone n=1 Tax=Nostoc punctiforme FACHB-252 TaxID=1357509 RepID=A0ABR8HMC5_NOSPU|nr:molecular chaperone [Nostoc punctiforme]MBD2616210.1 molecular chaperone [Nostoc punctiforme FACHB-252]